MLTILILSLVGAVISAGVGTFWYSPFTPMGRLHMRYLGFDKLSKEEQEKEIEKAKPAMPKIYGAQLALSFLTSFAVVMIIMMSMRNSLPFSFALLFVVFNWLAFVVPTIGQGILWGTCDRKIAWKKFFSDSSSNLVSVLILAVIASFFA